MQKIYDRMCENMNKENEMKKKGRPRKFDNPDMLFQTGIEYIQECIDNGEPLTVTGLCLALDTTKETLGDYVSGKYNEDGKNFSDPIKRLKLIVENGYEKRLHYNNPTGGIFALKNFPKTKIKYGSAAKSNWALEGRHHSYLATSFNGTLTGMRGNLGIIDDPVKDAEVAYNESELENQWNWYCNTFLQRMIEGAL